MSQSSLRRVLRAHPDPLVAVAVRASSKQNCRSLPVFFFIFLVRSFIYLLLLSLLLLFLPFLTVLLTSFASSSVRLLPNPSPNIIPPTFSPLFPCFSSSSSSFVHFLFSPPPPLPSLFPSCFPFLSANFSSFVSSLFLPSVPSDFFLHPLSFPPASSFHSYYNLLPLFSTSGLPTLPPFTFLPS